MSPNKPNLLVIHADQHRHDCIGAAGNKDVKTPNIDALARDGTIFTHCFATFPVCTPSRYSLLTGLYAHQHLGFTNQSTIPDVIPTFPRILRHAGYATACVGKMHFTPTYLDVGFEKMLLAEQDGPGRYDDDYHRYLMAKGAIDFTDARDQVLEFRTKAPPAYFANFGTDRSALDDRDFSTTWIGDRALECIDTWNGGGGNLLMAGFIKPHHPLDAPSPWADMYDPEKIALLPGWTETCLDRDRAFSKGFFDYTKLDEARMRRIMAQYYASISQIDAQVGKMVELLKNKGLYDDTLVIYTSDHGDYMGFHHLVLKGNYMYDPVIRVPLVVKAPGQKGSKVVSNLVSIIDITAKVIDAAGCLVPRDLWDQVQPVDEADRDVIFAEDGNKNYMVRTRNRKLLLCSTFPSQLFDLEKDPIEMENRIDDAAYQDDVARLKEALFKWLAFESRPPAYENLGAKSVTGKNIPAAPAKSHERVKGWYRQQMDALSRRA
nr:sulfatase-like hydrolase/transferase [Candidatus Sigynarchaeota archaeon]